MIEFLKRLFGQQGSSATAKERLRLVLMSDHLELAPEMIDKMKHDLVDVISRYVEVDRDRIEVNFERQDRTLAMLANIPIISVNRPNGNGSLKHESTPVAETAAASLATPEPAMIPPAPVATSPVEVTAPPPRRRRRRKKAKSNGGARSQ